MWSPIDRLQSNHKPRFQTENCGAMTECPTVMPSIKILASCYLVPIKRSSVLASFTSNLSWDMSSVFWTCLSLCDSKEQWIPSNSQCTSGIPSLTFLQLASVGYRACFSQNLHTTLHLKYSEWLKQHYFVRIPFQSFSQLLPLICLGDLQDPYCLCVIPFPANICIFLTPNLVCIFLTICHLKSDNKINIWYIYISFHFQLIFSWGLHELLKSQSRCQKSAL